MHATFATCQTVLALDVGKASHWAFMATRSGEVLANRPVANREADLDALFASAPEGTLVVVDQKRNIGALALRRARLAGLPVGYLPGLAAHEASKLFAGDAKTDERDAAVIAKTALGVPDALLPVPETDPRLEAARSMAAQREHMVACATRDKNRLRSILLESCPAFEALADLSDPHWLGMLGSLGGPWGSPRRRQGVARSRHPRRRQGRDRRCVGRGGVVHQAVGVAGRGREPAGQDAR